MAAQRNIVQLSPFQYPINYPIIDIASLPFHVLPLHSIFRDRGIEVLEEMILVHFAVLFRPTTLDHSVGNRTAEPKLVRQLLYCNSVAGLGANSYPPLAMSGNCLIEIRRLGETGQYNADNEYSYQIPHGVCVYLTVCPNVSKL